MRHSPGNARREKDETIAIVLTRALVSRPTDGQAIKGMLPILTLSAHPVLSSHMDGQATLAMLPTKKVSAHPVLSLNDLVMDIKGYHRRREDFLRAELDMLRRVKSQLLRPLISKLLPPCAGDMAKAKAAWKQATDEANKLLKDMTNGSKEMDVVVALLVHEAFLTVVELLHVQRMLNEKELVKKAKQLPIADFVESTSGFGYLGLAQIIAEAGDLSNYANPAKLWKRMGLAVIDGKAQRKVKLDKEEAVMQGFNPHRRAIMHVIGVSLMMKTGGQYRRLYLERKAKEAEKTPDLTPMHIHNRALRFIEKRLLLDIWKAWRDEVRTNEKDGHEEAAARTQG